MIGYIDTPGVTRRDPGWLIEGCNDAKYEHDLYVVVSSRSLRVLNPWARISNAVSVCKPERPA
jgi:hypothetical protein